MFVYIHILCFWQQSNLTKYTPKDQKDSYDLSLCDLKTMVSYKS